MTVRGRRRIFAGSNAAPPALERRGSVCFGRTHTAGLLRSGRSREKFPDIVVGAKGILERFSNALSCIDPCCIAEKMLKQLPAPSPIGKSKVGGIDLNKARRLWVVEALIARSPSPDGFTASELARQVRVFGKQSETEQGARRAAYDLKKLRGKKIVRRIGKTHRYESLPKGLKALATLVVLRNKAIQPLLAAAQDLRPPRGAQNPSPIDTHYDPIRTAMRGVFQELGLAAGRSTIIFSGFASKCLKALLDVAHVASN